MLNSFPAYRNCINRREGPDRGTSHFRKTRTVTRPSTISWLRSTCWSQKTTAAKTLRLSMRSSGPCNQTTTPRLLTLIMMGPPTARITAVVPQSIAGPLHCLAKTSHLSRQRVPLSNRNPGSPADRHRPQSSRRSPLPNMRTKPPRSTPPPS